LRRLVRLLFWAFLFVF